MERKIIDQCLEHFPGKMVNSSALVPLMSRNHDEIKSCLKHMNETNLLEVLRRDLDGNYHFVLAYNAIHHRQILLSQIWSFLFKSILIPIGVSIVTSVATVWLLKLLKLS